MKTKTTELSLIRRNYYEKIFVLFELIKSMRNREVVFMHRHMNERIVRGLHVKTVDYLKEFMRIFNFLDGDFNIYISSATYNSIPPFTYNLRERSAQTSEWFNNYAVKEIEEYDILLDFDCKDNKDWLDMFDEVKLMFSVLSECKVCFRIMPSGKNFHIIFPGSSIPFGRMFSKDVLNIESYNGRVKRLVTNIKKIFKLKYLDLKLAGIYNRIMKCPYSLVDGKVCLPISRLNPFSYASMNSYHILKNVMLRDRGLMLLNDYGVNRNKNNMTAFINKYYLEV